MLDWKLKLISSCEEVKYESIVLNVLGLCLHDDYFLLQSNEALLFKTAGNLYTKEQEVVLEEHFGITQ